MPFRPASCVLALAACALVTVASCGTPAEESPASPAEAPRSVTPPPPEIARLLGEIRQALSSGQSSEAIQLAEQALAIDSTSAEVNNLLATAQGAQGLHTEAMESAQRALRHNPDFALAHLNIGGMYFRLQQLDEAETHLRRAVELEPNEPSLNRRLADVYRTTQRPDLALQYISRARQLRPQEAAFAHLHGMCLEQAGILSEAIAAYKVATRLDPSLVEAWERIAASGGAMDGAIAASARDRLARLQSIDAEAAETFRQLRVAILNSPEDPSRHYQLGAFLLANALTEEGLIKFQQVANMRPDDARLLNHMGGLLSRAQRLDDSLPFYFRAADAKPDDPTALLNAGSVYAMRGENELALPLYERALARAPDSPQVHYFFGLALNNAGDQAKAREILEAGLALAADSESAAQLQQVLDTLGEAGP